MAEIAKTASRTRGLEGRTDPELAEQSRQRLGPIADAVLLDAQLNCQHAHNLGWRPNGRSLLHELASKGNS